MNPFSEIETQLLTGFAVALAYGIAGVGLIVAVTIFAWEAWQAAHAPEPEPAPPVTVTPPEAVPARVTHLVLLPDPPHRPWVDDAQGHCVVRGKGVGK